MLKINNNNLSQRVFDTRLNKAGVSKPANTVQGKKFDEIIIEKSAPTNLSESDFSTALKTKVSAELKLANDAKKLEEIKANILSGNYEVNANEVTRKLMIGLI